MDDTAYGFGVDLPLSYETAIECVTAVLRTEGFEVLTTIDVKATLKKKLDRDFRKYVILGACNPALANHALQTDLEIGLLLPCNVIVYETAEGTSRVAAMAPFKALSLAADTPELINVAARADERLRRALTSLESDARKPSTQEA